MKPVGLSAASRSQLSRLLHDHPNAATKLEEYAAKLSVGSVCKRLGYLLQRDHRDQDALIALCQANLSTGYAKLDPALPSDRLITTWRVWVSATELSETRR